MTKRPILGRGPTFVSLCAALFLASLSATVFSADPPTNTSFPVNLLRPAPGPSNFITIESPEIGPDMTPSVDLVLPYQHRPFVLLACDESNSCDDGSNTLDAVSNLLTLDLMGGFTFLERFQAGLVVPLTLWQAGTGFVAFSGAKQLDEGEEYNSFIIGDLRLHLKARIFGEEGAEGPSVSVSVEPSLPLAKWTGMGSSDDTEFDGAYGYGGSGSVSVMVPKIIAGYRIKQFRSAVNIGFLWREKAEFFSTEIGHTLNFGAAVAYAVLPEIEIIGELYGNKSLVSENFTDSESVSLLFLGGGRFNLGDFHFQVGGGGGILSGVGVPDFQVIAGLGWVPSPKEDESYADFEISSTDKDGDGIENSVDQCPDEPEDRDDFEDTDGCPDDDNDKDGVVDGYDSCPNEPEDKDGFRDDDGCPDLDHDEDGIKVPDDQCPDRAEDFDGFEDEDGCVEEDNDNDGLLDADDICPNDAEDKDGFEDEDGCPEFDNDNDGVPDTADKCPDEAEVLNTIADDDGCSDRVKPLVVLKEDQIELKEELYFKPATDQIRGKQSFAILNIIADILKGNPVLRVSVEGHTDNRGNAAANRNLSKRRAGAVKEYLVKQGIDAERLETVGWGPDKPIADNSSQEGRAANRRMEFIIMRPYKLLIEQADEGDAAIEGDDGGFEMDFTEGDPGADMDFTIEEPEE